MVELCLTVSFEGLAQEAFLSTTRPYGIQNLELRTIFGPEASLFSLIVVLAR